MYKDWVYKMGAHKCPKCNVPIEKNSGCSHMSCLSCNHRWCWVCGSSLNHWAHKLAEMSPFSCKFVPKSALGWIGFFLLFIFGFVLIPIMIVGMILFGACYLCFSMICGYGLKRSCKRGPCCTKIVITLCCGLPFIILMALGISLALPVAAIVLAVVIVPVYIFHTYFFLRTLFWWCKRSRAEV